ncbi:MAG: DUF5011 domain-containing protein, partial [Verrucomicrobia bacterium]|nr:DUF5011 domain-containing protein [Verrucomicrobiota bacterium]
QIVTVNPVNPNVVGTYTVTYNVSDGSGNAAVEVTRTVIVQDTQAPVPDVASLPEVIGECGGVVTLTPPTATDACSGTITGTTTNVVNNLPEGNYTVVWTYTDAASNSVTQTQIVRIHDAVPPVIALLGASPVTIECHGTYSDAGATASDNCGGNLTSQIVTVNPVNANVAGTYLVTYNVSDAAGNPAVQVTRTVFVRDAAPPVPNAPILPDVATQCTVTLTRPTATDACAGTITATTTNPLTYSAQGDYTIYWTYTDGASNSVTQTQAVRVHDTVRPVIALAGTSPVIVECHGTYADAGATASDNCGGNLTSQMVTVNPVNVNVAGTYLVTYNVSDAAGNAALQVTRTVIVRDAAPPVPNVANLPDATGECTVVLTAPTATDACSGIIIATTTNSLAYVVEGQYTVYWTYTDASSNRATQIQLVRVHDTTSPVITLAGTSPVTVECHGTYSDAGATASDNCSKDMTSQIVTVNPVNVNVPGTYTVTYNVTDAGGNAANPVSRTVIVRDTVAPVPNVASLPQVNAQCSVTLTAPTATDACAGTITATTTDPLTYSAPGEYTVRWTYTDANSNSVSQTQVVKVQDTTDPVITVCASAQTQPAGTNCQAVVPNFATNVVASDNCSGSLTFIQSPAAGTLVGVGVHEITLTVRDAAGNDTDCETTFTVTAPAAQPIRVAVTKLPSGAVRVAFTNTPGGCVPFTVLASTSLQGGWTELGHPTETPANSGRYEFTDLTATNYPVRFYRVTSP